MRRVRRSAWRSAILLGGVLGACFLVAAAGAQEELLQELKTVTRVDIIGRRQLSAGAIRKVEISTDGGERWQDAELRSPAYPMAHTRFGFHWKWDGKECVLMSRCTDELGTVQPTRAEVAKYWNDLPDRARIRGNDNTVQPWKVASDGSVRNGLS